MILILLALFAMEPRPQANGSTPAAFVRVRVVRPQAIGQRVLALFEGAKAPNPAAALAAYRRAKGGSSGLSKGAEAAIAVLNPRMIAEFALVDDATAHFSRALDGRLAWNALIPRDDGSIEALSTAMVLTDGASLPPIDGIAVDRLGPAGAPLMLKARNGLVVASSTMQAEAGLARSRLPIPAQAEPGLFVSLDPQLLAAPGGPINARRLGVSLVGLGCSGLDGSIGLEGDTLLATFKGRYSAQPAARPKIDPKWLDAVPTGDTIAAFALAIDPSPQAWNALFAHIDQVEKVDPARANVAPSALRLGLLLRSARVKPDVDLWPILNGVSGFVTADMAGKASGALVRLHVKDEASATRLANETIPRLVFSLRLKTAKTAGVFGFVAGRRTIAVHVRGDSVGLAWGDTLPVRSLDASTNPAASAGALLRSATNPSPERFVAFWPGKLPALVSPEAPPVVWTGRFDGDQSLDQIRWPGLKPLVKRLLDRLPLDPPPDVASPVPGGSK